MANKKGWTRDIDSTDNKETTKNSWTRSLDETDGEKANSVFSDYSDYAKRLSEGLGTWQDKSWFEESEATSKSLSDRLNDMQRNLDEQKPYYDAIQELTRKNNEETLADIRKMKEDLGVKSRAKDANEYLLSLDVPNRYNDESYKLKKLTEGLKQSDEIRNDFKETYGSFENKEDFDRAMAEYTKSQKYKNMTDEELQAESDRYKAQIDNAKASKPGFFEELGGQLNALYSGKPYYNSADQIEERIANLESEASYANNEIARRKYEANQNRLRNMTIDDINANVDAKRSAWESAVNHYEAVWASNTPEAVAAKSAMDAAERELENAKADIYDFNRLRAGETEVPGDFDVSGADIRGLFKYGDQGGLFEETDFRKLPVEEQNRMIYLYTEANKTRDWTLVNAYKQTLDAEISELNAKSLAEFIKNMPEWADYAALLPLALADPTTAVASALPTAAVHYAGKAITGSETPISEAEAGVVLGLQSAFDNAVKAFDTISRNGDTFTYKRSAELASAYVAEDMGKVEKVVWDLMVNTGNQLPHMAVSALTKSKMAGLAVMGVQVYGSSFEEGLSMGMTTSQARDYAIIDTALEVGLESLLGNIPGVRGVLSEKVGDKLASTVKTQAAKVVLSYLGGAWGEFVEEGLQDVISPILQNIILGQEIDFSTDAWVDRLGDFVYSGLIGALSSIMLGGSAGFVQMQNAINEDNAVRAIGKEKGAEGVSKLKGLLDAESNAYKIADKINEKSTAYDIGEAIINANMAVSDATIDHIKAKLIEQGFTEEDAEKNAQLVFYFTNQSADVDEVAEYVLRHDPILASVLAEVFTSDEELANRIRTQQSVLSGETLAFDTAKTAFQKKLDEAEADIETFDDEAATLTATKKYLSEIKTEVGSLSDQAVTDFTKFLKDGKSFNYRSNALKNAYIYGYLGYNQENARSMTDGLSENEFNIAYNDGKLQAFTDKNQPAFKSAPSVKPGKYSVTFAKGVTAKSDIQKAQVKQMEALSQALGLNFVIEGESLESNGWFDPKNDTVHININAGTHGAGTMMFTVAHELTHFIEKWNTKQYTDLVNFVKNEMGDKEFEYQVDQKRKFLTARKTTTNGIDNSYRGAISEVIADSMENMLTDGEVIRRLASENKSLFARIKKFIDDIIAKIEKFLNERSDYLDDAGKVVSELESFKEIQRMWGDALKVAGKNYTGTAVGGVFMASDVENLTDVEFTDAMAEQGVAVDTESGSAMFSWKTAPYMWSKSKIEEVAKALAQRFDIPEKVARKQLRDQMALSNLFFNPVYNEALDFAHDENSPLQENSDYGLTVDFSNICRKRLVYTAMIDALQKANPNYVFNGEDYADVRRIMQLTKGEDGKGLEVACGLCYVEDRRQDLGKTAQSFRSALEGYRNGTDKFVFTDGKTLSISEKFSGKLQRVYDALEAINDDYTPTVYDLTTVRGMNDLRKNHPSIADAFEKFNSARGQSAQNLLQNEREYTGQILEHFANAKGGKINLEEVQKFNDHGGLRIYSYSDFIEYHIQDVLQVIQDCANVGLKMQGYTKVVEFAKMVRNTNIKLNLSVIPAGDTGIHNGKLVCDVVEGIDMESDEVKELIKNKNIGIIIIGINHEQVRMAMADSRISYIIPYHTNQDGLSRFLKKTDKWFNYKEEQMEREWVTNDKGELVLKNTDKKKMVNIYTDVLQAAEDEGKPITNRKQFQEKFFEVCEERGIVPRFDRFINKDADGKYVYTPGYEKLLLDYKLFDGNGNILPQEVVQAKFNRGELRRIVDKFAGEAGRDKLVQNVTKSATFKLAFNALNDVIKTTGRVYQPEGKFKPIPNAKLGEAAAKVLKGSKESLETNDANYGEELTAKKPRVKNSLKDMSSSELNSTYMEYADRYEADHSVSTGEFLQRLLGEEAVRKGAITNDKGNAQLLYHGTNRFGFTEFSFPRGWFYATTRREVAGNYGGRGYTSVKRIGEIKNAKNLDELTRKYNRRNGTNFRKVTESDFKEYTKKIYDIAEKAATKYDDLYGKYYKTDYIQKMLEDEHLRNLWDWMVDSIYTWQSFGDDYGKDESAVDNLKTATNKSVETRDELVKYLSDHHDEWKNTDSAPLLKYIMGYEFGDAVANTAWAADKFDADVIEVSKDGYMDFRTEEGLRNYFDDTTGAYELYGFDGGKVLEVDAENHDWLSVKFDGAYHSTDYIAKWAKDNGYTAVLVKNVYDGGPMADEYIFFSPERVKSADPITYDSNGNIIPLSERFNKSNDDIRYSFKEVTPAEVEKMKKHFGTTKDFREAGYLLKDGTMLDFSGRHWTSGDTSYLNGSRTVDHRDIQEVLNRDEDYVGMDDMIGSGEIRLMPESYGISIGQMPTNQQISKLYDFFSRFNDADRYVDFCTEDGYTIAEVAYNGKTSPSRIINDIKKFYEDGTRPNGTAVQYSLKEGEDYVRYGHRALYTEQRVDNLLKSFAIESSPNESQGWIAWAKPSDFVPATTTVSGLSYIYGQETPLDEERLKNEKQPIFLDVEVDDNGKPTRIVGHEGRHRSMAIASQGISTYPVVLFERDFGKWVRNRESINIEILTGQKWMDERGRPMFVRDLTPLDYAHRDEIIQKFATQTENEKFGEKIGSLNTLRYSLKSETGRTLAPTFYSKLELTLEQMPKGKYDASTIVKTLQGKGVKAEEIKWSGIPAYLEGKKSVTKDELLNVARANRMQIEEITLGNDGTKYREFVIGRDKQVDNYREMLFTMPESNYESPHWAERGVLVHARTTDRMKQGGKVLFVEEVQSDLHNAGHIEGYLEKGKSKGEVTKKYFASKDDRDKAYLDLEHYLDVIGVQPSVVYASYLVDRSQKESTLEALESEEKVTLGQLDRIRELINKFNTAVSIMHDYLADVWKVEDAPFRDTYQDFAMKKMLRLASESDYEYIGWTTARQQEERWSGEFAEGYKIEYDQQIPKFMNKFGKQFGTQVEKITLDNGYEVWGMKITPEMRESVLYAGQPLFSLKDNTSSRQLLADAMSYVAQTAEEQELINKYADRVKKLDSLEQKAQRIQQYLSMLDNGEISASDLVGMVNAIENLKVRGMESVKTVDDVREAYERIRKSIMNADSSLLELEAQAPIKALLKYSREQARTRTRELIQMREKMSKTRQRIYKQLDKFHNMLTKPKKNKYVPASMVESVIDFIESINRETGYESTHQKILAMQEQYEKLKANEIYKNAYDEVGAQAIKNLAETIPNKPVSQMTQEELNTVDKALTTLSYIIETGHLMLDTHIPEFEGVDVHDISQTLGNETSQVKRYSRVEQYILHYLNSSARPSTVFAALSGFEKNSYWDRVYKMLENGALQSYRYRQGASKFFEGFEGKLDYGNTNNLYDIGIKDSNGNEIKMTKGMMLALYMHMLNEDNARHAILGGITLPNMKMYYGKSKAVAYNGAENRYLGNSAELAKMRGEYQKALKALDEAQTDADRQMAVDYLAQVERDFRTLDALTASIRQEIISKITSNMNDTDWAYVRAVQEFYKWSSKMLNEVTMKAYGFPKATVENYFPIVVDRDWLKMDIENFGRSMEEFSVENAGFMKDRVKSSKPITLIDIADQVYRSTTQSAQYYGYMLPLRNFKKVYGDVTSNNGVPTPLRKTINDTFYSNKNYMTSMIDHLVKNLNGEQTKQYMAWARGNLARAALTLNPRVAGSQAASYFAALPMLDAKSMIKGLQRGFKRSDRALIDKWSPLVWYRTQGSSANTMGEVARKTENAVKLENRLGYLTKWIEKVDEWTVNRLWYASEAYVSDHTDLKVGSDEYYEAVAEKFNEVVLNSQPNYDTINRPEVLRTENPFLKLFTMFYTQRLQNFSLLYESIGRATRAEADLKAGKISEEEYKSAKKDVANNAVAQVGSALTLTALKTLVDMLMKKTKPYKDDEGELDGWWKTALANFAETMVGNMFFISNLYEAVEKMITGDTYYGVSIAGFDTIVDASKALVNAIQKPSYKTVNKALMNIAQAVGFPVNNIESLANALYTYIRDITDGEFHDEQMDLRSDIWQAILKLLGQ